MRRGLVLAAAGVGAVFVSGSLLLATSGEAPQAAQAVRETPVQGDPLTPEEIARAGEIATAVNHLKGGRAELLYVERDDDKDAEQARQAEAYIYDYASDTLIVRTVDLGRSKVIEETKGRGVQPPPSRREELRAAELLLADPKLGRGVRQSFRKAAGRELASPSDLALRGLIYSPERGSCAEHRCLRLFVRLPNGTFLDTSRIVIDLSAQRVHILEW
ncbi:hypothetical protein [Nonomuraea africana]|uniref:Tat pathway signal sequence domain protein n=1 Tax=Nonomuraea africana TaxID=46171 RepID=A0ABR9KM37_9ACTN|nr:hypothetical protein [Nonomuraea africana]MBE1563050.1 hypothetical protein [Nonomuraea africana]